MHADDKRKREMAASLRGGISRLLNFRVCGLCTSVSRRQIHRQLPLLAMSEADFNAAKDRLNTLKEDPGNEVKLQIYGLFKQATVGKCNTAKPGAFDFVGKAKWTAWNSLGDMTQDQAREKYIGIVADLAAQQGVSTDAGPAPATDAPTFDGLTYSVDSGVATITLNRPKKKNAITTKMYEEWGRAFKTAAEDDSVVIAVVTGAGDYYCSGNDLSNFMSIDPSNLRDASKEGSDLLEIFINAFVDFPKPLVAAVNGPAVGVSVTTLGLMDVVYASDRATFHTPFAALGQSPEGCSSYTFPKMMGAAQANEVLLFGRKLTAQEACERGLVTEVIPDAQFKDTVDKKIKEYAQLPRNALQLSKKLIRDTERDLLHKVNRAECDLLIERWTSDECAQAIMNFFSKSKL